jgi:glycosyltransferase involved in cell wall biosynthesis
MIFNRLYYFFKPYIPWSIRLAIRRRWAASRRVAHSDVWPIDAKAGTTPPRWPGWPAGKRFALVLTHDVEGEKGLGRVEQIMKLESKHGFCSSFNFVPEGEYCLPASLRQTMDRAGFEIGVHGLEHDGKLYGSKERFAEKASRIREYLQNWNASGFRSPLMQHRMAWLHQLGVEYDSSTFDTDPFEPEPDDVQTIFPFWVPGPAGTGYVEMPYTLPQDFTLFVVLRERNIDVWKRKLDWIAEHGGMALLNTHPDYICPEGGKAQPDEYPVAHYEEFLCYAREKYGDLFWHALPRDVSRYYCGAVPSAARNSRKKICVLAYTNYESDGRVRRYAETLTARGDLVEVIALSGGNVPLGAEKIGGVTAYRIQHRQVDERHKWTYAWRLLRFMVVSSVFLARRHRQMCYDLVHVHNMPDFLVFAAWYPKLTGTKLILDIHDVVPELFVSKFGVSPGNHYVRWLRKAEKASASFVDHVIVANHLWHRKLIERSVPEEKCTVFLNHIDPAVFYRRARTRNDGKFIVLFPGTFQWHQGLDIAIEALAHIKGKVPSAELHLYGGGGGGGTEAQLAELANRLGLNAKVKFCGGVPFDQIAEVIANADLGIVPKRANSFGNEAYSTKIMEFMSQGVPAVVSRTKVDSFYFDDTVVRFFTSGDSKAMADAMMDVIENKELRETLVKNGLEYAARNSWDCVRNDYLVLVDSLMVENFGSSRLAVAAKIGK